MLEVSLRVAPELTLPEALSRAFSTPGVVLVDCPVDYSENEVLYRDLATEVSALCDRT